MMVYVYVMVLLLVRSICLDCGLSLYSWYCPKLANTLEFYGDPTALTGSVCVTCTSSNSLESIKTISSTSTTIEDTQGADLTTTLTQIHERVLKLIVLQQTQNQEIPQAPVLLLKTKKAVIL